MIQVVACALQSARSAGDREPAILTKRSLAEWRQVIEIEIHVVGDVEIEIAIVVVVAEGSAGSPASRIADASLGGHIGEGPVAIVVIQHGAVEIRDVQVFFSIVVVVAYRGSESPAAVADSGLSRHIGECAVVIVVVELAGVALAGFQIFDEWNR